MKELNARQKNAFTEFRAELAVKKYHFGEAGANDGDGENVNPEEAGVVKVKESLKTKAKAPRNAPEVPTEKAYATPVRHQLKVPQGSAGSGGHSSGGTSGYMSA